MPAHVTQPAVVHGQYWASTADILDNIRANTAQDDGAPHPKFAIWERVIRNSGVQRRPLAQPLDAPVVSGATGLEDRNAAAWAATQDMAEQAARQAIEQAGITPGDIDSVITSHTTSWAVPQLDITLINRLGLRPDVRTTALATLACVGGTKALGKAADDVAVHPGARVLVVVSEAITSIYHHADQTTESQIYKALFGDSAGACIVTDTPLQPGLAIDAHRQYVLPDSAHNSYWGRLDTAGFHFDSTKAALRGPKDVLPDVVEWLKTLDLAAPDWALVHAGGPAIISAVQAGLSLSDEQVAHTWASLAENGNLGGISVLDVLRRTHTTPPAPGTRGLALSFGPGFTYATLAGTWTT
ncbi:PhlD [Streptomyces sp. NPDC059740]|uniref:PhlD n=1 Tax=Streptomyces sp. NPDC059740 TaxID=3346926 RepID=UPI003666556F